jgi:RecA-family ATPase
MLTDSTFNQKVQQEIVDGWRVAIITLPDYPEKLFAFAEMAADISSRWDNKADAVDTLLNVALVTGLTDAFGRREIEHTIGRAWSENNKPNGQGDNKGRTRLDEPPPFTYVDIARELVPREWVVPDRVPAKNITLLSGEGAVGKSILLLQLSAAIVLGRDWIGTLPKQGVVLYLSCEDDDDEINRRLEDIAKHYGVTRADLKASLHVISLAGKDAILGTADRTSKIKPTALFAQLRAEAQRLHPTLIVIDTVADVFGGDEINRAQTRHFLTLLRGLITEIDSAMVLASHPSLEGIRSGSGISGSTAWHNSVRSRMYFRIANEVDDAELRVLEVKKANYAKVSEQILLRWKNGVYVPEPRAGSLDQMAADKKIDDLFIDLLRRFTKDGRNVSDSRSPTYAPRVFEDEPEAKAAKATRKTLAEAMKRLFAAGKIRVAPTSGPPSRRRIRSSRPNARARSSCHSLPLPTPLPTPFQRLPTGVCHTHPPYPPVVLEGVGAGWKGPPLPTLARKIDSRVRKKGSARLVTHHMEPFVCGATGPTLACSRSGTPPSSAASRNRCTGNARRCGSRWCNHEPAHPRTPVRRHHGGGVQERDYQLRGETKIRRLSANGGALAHALRCTRRRRSHVG